VLVNTRTKWAIGITVGVFGVSTITTWLTFPYFLKRYVNGLKPGVQVDEVKWKSWDCAQLRGIHIDRPNVKGVLTQAVACKDAKTFDADGGKLEVTLMDGDPKEEGDGFTITAKNLQVHVTRGKWTADAEGVTLDSTKVCGAKATAKHKGVEASLESPCLDRKTKVVTFTSGEATPDLEFQGHKVGKVSFGKGFFDPVGSVQLDSLVRAPVSFQGLSVSLQDGKLLVKARGVTVTHERLYTAPVTLQNVEVIPIDLKSPSAGDLWVSVNGAKLNFNLDTKHAWGSEPCQKWLGAVPQEMKIDPIPQVKFVGDFKFDLKIEPDVKLSLTNTCKIDGPRPAFIKALDGKFKYTAYHPGTKPFERETGSGTLDWTPLQAVSPNMATALTTTEDPGFFGHRGFITAAIENSLRDNMKLGKFFRGGSTLTMQLAKNLWLSRTRTIGRKVQEAILTVALESTLPKDKILELYLNVVEFGPDIYGIGPASRTLLHKEPMTLSIPESLYLVLRLPAPNNSASYEQKKGLIKRLMDNIAASGKVPAELIEVEKGLLDSDTQEIP